MTDIKTPPLGSELAMDDTLPGSLTPFGDSSLLDLDDPHITGSLLGSFGESHLEPPLDNAASVAPADDALLQSDETSFAQLWASTLTDNDNENQAPPAEPQHHAADHFAIWKKAIERHHLPTAVELLPPVPSPSDDENTPESAASSTGFFSPDDAPLFFVDEQWSPDAFPYAEDISQNPFEESVAVLNELSFQNAFPETRLGNALAPIENPQPLFSPLVFHTAHFETEFLPDNLLSDSLLADNTTLFPADSANTFSNSATPLSNLTGYQDSPSQLQSNLWLLEASGEANEDDILLLEEEVPPEEEAGAFASLDMHHLHASAQTSAQNFPPKIPPVLPPSVPPLLTPAIFYDFAQTSGPPLQGVVPPHTSANFQTQGFYEVVLYTMSGAVKRGAFQDVDLGQPTVLLQTPEETEPIAVHHIKAVYFMKPAHGSFSLPPATGAHSKVVFHDGRMVEGQLSAPQEEDAGFFLIPRQDKSPTAYLYINRSAVQEIAGAELM